MAGACLGLSDPRTGLVQRVYRIMDAVSPSLALPDEVTNSWQLVSIQVSLTLSFANRHGGIFLHLFVKSSSCRSWVLLENVGNLLAPDLRELLDFVFEALLRLKRVVSEIFSFFGQEFRKRGFHVAWCTMSGKNVGCQALLAFT